MCRDHDYTELYFYTYDNKIDRNLIKYYSVVNYNYGLNLYKDTILLDEKKNILGKLSYDHYYI